MRSMELKIIFLKDYLTSRGILSENSKKVTLSDWFWDLKIHQLPSTKFTNCPLRIKLYKYGYLIKTSNFRQQRKLCTHEKSDFMIVRNYFVASNYYTLSSKCINKQESVKWRHTWMSYTSKLNMSGNVKVLIKSVVGHKHLPRKKFNERNYF